MTPTRLLYVESSPGTSLHYPLLLQEHGFAVDVAGNGRAAMGQLSSAPVDAVIISQDPASAETGGDGFRLAAEIKRQSPEMPVVMVSHCKSVVEDAPRFVDGAFWNDAPLAGLVEMLQRLADRPAAKPPQARLRAVPAFVA
jgi:DNA-binding NtrC family response regulator